MAKSTTVTQCRAVWQELGTMVVDGRTAAGEREML
jgi:hypothetical protein